MKKKGRRAGGRERRKVPGSRQSEQDCSDVNNTALTLEDKCVPNSFGIVLLVRVCKPLLDAPVGAGLH